IVEDAKQRCRSTLDPHRSRHRHPTFSGARPRPAARAFHVFRTARVGVDDGATPSPYLITATLLRSMVIATAATRRNPKTICCAKALTPTYVIPIRTT